MGFYSTNPVYGLAAMQGKILYTGGELVVQDVDLVQLSDGGGSLGNATDDRFANIYATTSFTANAAMAIGATVSTTKGLFLVNTTDAAIGAQQCSPSIVLGGETWDADGAVTKVQKWRFHHLGTQANDPVANLILGCDPGDATFDVFMTCAWDNVAGSITLGQDIDLLWTTDAVSDIGTVTANSPSGIYAGSNFTLSRAFALTNTVSTTKGLFLTSTTVATGGATIQHSPPIVLSGSTWDTDGSAKTTKWSFLSGGNSDTAPTAHLRFYGDNGDGTGANQIASLYWTGSQGGIILQHATSHLLWNTDNAGSIGAATANRPLDAHIARAWHIYGDSGGTANSLSLANSTTSPGAVTPTLGTNAPTVITVTTPNTWVKIYIGTSARYFPIWA